MYAKLLLVALLLVLVVLGDGRNLNPFQTQIYQATNLNINDTSTCEKFPCVFQLNEKWSSSICKEDFTTYRFLTSSLIKCYSEGICGSNFTIIQLPYPVNITFGAGDYNEIICYVYGDQETMKLTNQSIYNIIPLPRDTGNITDWVVYSP